MKDKRNSKITQLIKKELSLILQRDLRDPRLQNTSISYLTLSNDLAYAKVYITNSILFSNFNLQDKQNSCLNTKAENNNKLKALNNASPYVRTIIASRLNLRNTPVFTFYYDDIAESLESISGLVDQLQV